MIPSTERCGNVPCSRLGICNSSIPICYPFVKWAGGKRQIISQLRALVPHKFVRYIEPFLGGAAMFLDLASDKNRQFSAYISDINLELINEYVMIKNNVEQLIKLLTEPEIGYNQAPEEYFYELRDKYNLRTSSDNIERSAQFIALNRTCFNGLYRVNSKGKFNVP
jgi:DNA adenine methylase